MELFSNMRLELIKVTNDLKCRQFLLSVACLLTSLYVIRYHWKRRRLYKLASKITKGLPSYPIIGSVPFFFGSVRDVQNKVNKKLDEIYPYLGKGWLGNTLIVAVSKPEHLEIILNHKHCLNKANEYYFLHSLLGHGLITANASEWRKNRKLIQPSFNQKVLNQFVPRFVENSEILLNVLKKYAGKGEFDVFVPISLCTLDNILETGIGLKVNAQTTDFQYSKWLSRLLELALMRGVFIPFHYDWIFNLSPQGRECSKLLEKAHNFIGTIVEKKRKEFEEKQNTIDFYDNERQKAFLDLLLELQDEGTYFTNQQISDEVNTIIGAATDTTATTSCFIMLMLGMHSDLQQKVYDEIIDTIGHDRPITADDLSRLKYMEMFIKETLRLFPSAPQIFRQPTRHIKVETDIIPAKTRIYLSILHTHRNGRIWKDPLKFDPNRFLPEECAKRHPYSYIPFSGGPRSCIGLKYAIMLLKTLVTTIVRKYEISTSYKNIEDIELGSDIVLKVKKGFYISITERCS